MLMMLCVSINVCWLVSSSVCGVVCSYLTQCVCVDVVYYVWKVYRENYGQGRFTELPPVGGVVGVGVQ